MIAIGVDPALTCVGVCAFDGRRLTAWDTLRAKSKESKLPLVDRCALNADRVVSWVYARHTPNEVDVVYVETPGRQARPGNRGGAGLISLGMGIMNIICDLRWNGYPVVPVEVGEWNRMGTSRFLKKEEKQAFVAAKFPEYDPNVDRGMDASDAIAMTAWKLGALRPKLKR